MCGKGAVDVSGDDAFLSRILQHKWKTTSRHAPKNQQIYSVYFWLHFTGKASSSLGIAYPDLSNNFLTGNQARYVFLTYLMIVFAHIFNLYRLLYSHQEWIVFSYHIKQQHSALSPYAPFLLQQCCLIPSHRSGHSYTHIANATLIYYACLTHNTRAAHTPALIRFPLAFFATCIHQTRCANTRAGKSGRAAFSNISL